MVLVGVGLCLWPLWSAGAGTTGAEKITRVEPAAADGSGRNPLGLRWHGQQEPGVCLDGKGIRAAFQYSHHAKGRARLRPAAQRPAFPGLTASRRTGPIKNCRANL